LKIQRRKSVTIPFGYRLSEDDSAFVEGIPEQLEALDKAMEFLEESSYREVATWLSAVTGRSLTHVGLMNIAKERRKQE